jgi:hypothetical protein
MVEIDKGVGGPEFFLHLFARYDFAAMLQQHQQNLKGLFLKPDLQTVLAQFTGSKIHLEDAKTEPPGRMLGFLHPEVNL